jgi:hypothetical protein
MTPQAEAGPPNTRKPQPRPVPQPAPAAVPRFRARRVTFVYPLLVQLKDRPGVTLRAHAANLSLGGMFIYSLQPPAPGTNVRIALEVRGRPLLLAEGEVRWIRGSAFKSYPWCPGFGVRFTHVPSKAVALVHYLVTKAGLQPQEPVPSPAPVPTLPKITDLDDPLDDQDHGTKQMYPIAPFVPAPEEALGGGDRPQSALEAQAKASIGAWRWLRWGLVVMAMAGWLAAIAQVRAGHEARAAVARSPRPADLQR